MIAGDHLGPHVGAVFAQLEEAVEHCRLLSVVRARRWRAVSVCVPAQLGSCAARPRGSACQAASRCMISAATKAAMTSGRLSGRPAAPIGQTSAPVSTGASSARAASARTTPAWSASRSCRHRPRRRAPAPRARSGSRARGRGSAPRRRRPAAPGAPPPRAAASARVSTPAGASAQLLGALVDQHRAHRQERQRRRRARGRHGRRRRSCTAGSARRSASAAARSALPARRRRAASTDSRVRPPQHWPISGPSGMSSVCRVAARAPACARAASIAMYSSWPPPMVPIIACARDHHPGAALARRRAARRLDPHQRRVALVAAEAVDRVGTHRHAPRRSAQPVDRHQHALRRRRRVEPRAVLVVGDARHRHRQRLEHRDRQHERRLADRLGAADRRLAVHRPVGELHVEDRRPVARRAGSCRSTARGCAAAPRRPTRAPRWSATPCPGRSRPRSGPCRPPGSASGRRRAGCRCGRRGTRRSACRR